MSNLTAEQKLRDIDLSRHAREGGTLITNLSEPEMVELAVTQYGDPRLVVHDKPSPAARKFPEWKSLHWIGDRDSVNTLNLSSFWSIVRRLELAHAEWLKLKDFAP